MASAEVKNQKMEFDMRAYLTVSAAAVSAAMLMTAVAAPASASPSPGFATGGMFGHAYGSRYAQPKVKSSYKKSSYKASKKSGKKRYYGKKRSKRSYKVSSRRSYGGGASRSCLKASARALLSRIESRFGRVQVISTCRKGATIRGSGKPSKHRYGLAVDFKAPGRKGAIVSWLRKNHSGGGTMTYSNHGHIHVDIGYRFVKLGARG